MAKRQSNTSENSAAEQGAKPGKFIPIPTAEITSAAEEARIRAEKEAEEACIRAEKEAEAARKKTEKEAKERADKKAADVVIALIRAIGTIEYTDACLEKINAAEQAYAKLTADQKKLVENADVIAASEKEYDRLKIAAEEARIRAEKEAEEARIRAEKEAEAARKKTEKEAKEKADKKAADAVVAMISAIGVVEYTDACLEKIYAANQAYAKLTADQKKFVENADVLTASEDKYYDLEEARKKAEQEAHDKEIESILLAYCKKKGSSLANSSRDHAEYDMPRNRYDEIYEYVLRKNKEQRNFCISLNGYDYFFYAASNNKSYGISAWRKINSDGLWNINESKKKIDRINKISAIVLILVWFFFLFINARYTWEANSWISAIIWAVITFAVFFGILVLWGKAEEQHPIDPASSGALAHLVWRICWVLGLSIICEIIMMVIFVF